MNRPNSVMSKIFFRDEKEGDRKWSSVPKMPTCLSTSYSDVSTGNKPAYTVGFNGLKPGNGSIGIELSAAYKVSPTLASYNTIETDGLTA